MSDPMPDPMPDPTSQVFPETIPDALLRAADRWPDSLAVVDGPHRVTWRELRERVLAVAAAYVAAGLRPGQHLGLWAPNCLDWVVAGLAVSHAGGVLVPLNSRYTAHEVGDILERTSAPLIVVANGFLGREQIAELSASGVSASVLDLAELATSTPADATRDEVAARSAALSPDDVADVLFTSGTTGRAKGAMSAHRQTLGVAAAWGEVAGVDAGDRYLIVNPFFHSFGYKAGICVCLLTGSTIYPQATFDIDACLDLIESEQITILPGAPTIFSTLLDSPRRHHIDLSSLRVAVTGAAVVPVALIERMQAELGIEVVLTAFGMTEAVVVTMCRPGDAPELVAATCGRAIPGIQTRIAGAQNPGEEGELLVRGPLVMLGYLGDDAATNEAIDANGWLHTGDVGTLDAQGNLAITDRIKDMYISGGFNVYPAEVEQALARLEGVADVAVVGVPDDRLGEVGLAHVVRASGAELTATDVQAYARERLANFKVPREVRFTEALPRNAMGKVLKTQLREAEPMSEQHE